jgi:hypothetical protein
MTPWWQLVLTELAKILPDIIAWIEGNASPADAAKQFLEHVLSFKKNVTEEKK